MAKAWTERGSEKRDTAGDYARRMRIRGLYIAEPGRYRDPKRCGSAVLCPRPFRKKGGRPGGAPGYG
jgi:hypothetical protein